MKWNFKINIETQEVFDKIVAFRDISFPEELKMLIIEGN